MARPADDTRPQVVWGQLAALLAPSTERLAFAARLALICALTTLVAETYQTPEIALTVYMAFFINRMDRASSLIMNAALCVFLALVICIIFAATVVVIDDPAARLASIGILSFGLLFLTSASKLRPVGAFIALIIGYALDLLGMVQAGEEATRALLYGWLFIGIPAAVSIVVNLFLAPAPRRLVERALARRLRVAAQILSATDARSRIAFDACLKEGSGEIPAWLKLIGIEKTSTSQDLLALHSAAQSTVAIVLLVDLAIRAPHCALPPSLRVRVAGVLTELAASLESGNFPRAVSLTNAEDEIGLSPVQASLLADLRAAFAGFAEAESAHPPVSAKPPRSFFLPDALSNPDHVQYALKTTGAALFCYCLYSLLDWPGIHTCFITCYIVGLPIAAESVEKLALRIVGCLVGAAVGILSLVFVMPSLTSINELMVVVFAGGLVAAWVAAGDPKIAYAGFQIAFAFFLCVIQGPAPAFDMVVARDRIIGILIGNLVSYVAAVYLWPVSVSRRVDPAINATLHSLFELATSPGAAARRILAARTLTAQGSIARDLRLIVYEPIGVRPGIQWMQTRKRTLAQLNRLVAPLLLLADSNRALSERAANLLARLGGRQETVDRAAVNPLTVLPIDHTSRHLVGDSAQLWSLVDDDLLALEKTLSENVEAPNHAKG